MLSEFFSPVPRKRKVKITHKSGIIYNNLNFAKKTLFYASNYIFLACILYLLYLYAPLTKAVFKYEIGKLAVEETPINYEVLATPTPSNEFELSIPKIGATATIVENVSPYNRAEYTKVLSENKVALAKGSFEPGSGFGKSTFIFAHSTSQGISLVRNNSVFYLLDDLIKGDEIFISMRGQIYKYRVYDKKVVNATDIKFLTYEDQSKEVLILQTCWPIGTDWKRLLIFGERI